LNAYNKGDTDKALVYFSKCLSKNENFHPALFNMGMIHYQRQELDQAFYYYDKLATMDSTFEDVLYKRGLVNYLKKQTTAAYYDFNSQLDIQPKNTLALMMRGAVLAELGKYKESLDDLSNIKESELLNIPGVMAYRSLDKLNLGDINGSLSDLNLAFNQDSAIGTAHAVLGTYYFTKRNYAKSIYHLEKALKLDNNTPSCINNLALSYTETGNFLKAETLLRNGMKSFPNFKEFYHNLGFICVKRFEVEKTKSAFMQAESNLRKANSMQTPLANTYQNLTYLYYLNQQPDSVIATCKTALKFFPENMYFVKVLNENYFNLNQDDEALKFLDQYIAEHPDYRDLFYIKGNFLRLIGKFEEAALWYKNKAMERGNDIPFNHEMADSLFLFAAYDYSTMCLENILNQSPQDTLAMIKLLRNITLSGQLISKTGWMNQKVFNKLMVRASTDPLAHLYTCMYWIVQKNISFDIILSSFGEVSYPNKQYIEYILRGINAKLSKSVESNHCQYFKQSLASGLIDARFFYNGSACK
ncbi:MAG TPA: tetratricopeptide repeat protein, partial [Bacteroidia bacterium]